MMNEHFARSSSSSRSSSSRSSTRSSSKSSTKSKSSTSPKQIAKPGSTVKTASGQSIKTSSTKPTDSKYTNQKGIVGDSGYSPRFTNGYTAPPGSVVYYPQHSFVDYLPWVYLFSQSSPQNDQVTVVQPDGKQIAAPPERGGLDGMAVFNWILLILIFVAIIGGIVWLVNKKTKKVSYA